MDLFDLLKELPAPKKSNHGGKRRGAGRRPSIFREALAAQRAAQKGLTLIDWKSTLERNQYRNDLRNSTRMRLIKRLLNCCPGCGQVKLKLRHWLVLPLNHVLERASDAPTLERRIIAGKCASKTVDGKVVICRECWYTVTNDNAPRNTTYQTPSGVVTICSTCKPTVQGHETFMPVPPTKVRERCDICGKLRHRDPSNRGVK